MKILWTEGLTSIKLYFRNRHAWFPLRDSP